MRRQGGRGCPGGSCSGGSRSRAWWVRWFLKSPEPAPSASVATAAASAMPTAVTDYPPPKTSSPEAAKEFGLAMQAWRDASWESAIAHLLRAAQIDPSFAAAHLWLAGGGQGTLDEQRKHLAAAVELRNQLSERDQAVLEVLQVVLGSDKPD